MTGPRRRCTVGGLADAARQQNDGNHSRDVLLILAITVPVTLIGIFIGERVQTRLSELTFRRLVDVTLITSGFALLVAH